MSVDFWEKNNTQNHRIDICKGLEESVMVCNYVSYFLKCYRNCVDRRWGKKEGSDQGTSVCKQHQRPTEECCEGTKNTAVYQFLIEISIVELTKVIHVCWIISYSMNPIYSWSILYLIWFTGFYNEDILTNSLIKNVLALKVLKMVPPQNTQTKNTQNLKIPRAKLLSKVQNSQSPKYSRIFKY